MPSWSVIARGANRDEVCADLRRNVITPGSTMPQNPGIERAVAAILSTLPEGPLSVSTYGNLDAQGLGQVQILIQRNDTLPTT